MSTAAIYTRISRDDTHEAKGVERQEADCRELGAKLGLHVVQVFTDNDRGASTRSTKARPEYAAMIAAARRREFSAIIAYSSSRLTRRPREAEDLLELVERHGVRLHTVASGSFDLTTADGRAVARTLAAWDAAEAERTAERVQRAALQRAQEGRTHGRTPYGWRRVDGVEVLDEEAAAVVRDSARRALEGESLRSIAAGLNAEGVPAPRGGQWNGIMLKQVLARERNAGRRIHKGEVIGRGNWPALLDEDTHDRLLALITDPSRYRPRGTDLQYWLSGILLCGRCGGRCRPAAGPKSKRADGRRPRTYVCVTCYRLRGPQEKIDDVVDQAMRARLALPDAPMLFAGDPEAAQAAAGEREALAARLDRAADDYADGKITAEQLTRITDRLRPRIAAADAAAAAAGPPSALGAFDGRVPPVDAWERATVAQKRAAVDALMTVTLLPTGAGYRFSRERVAIEWRAGA